MYIRVVCFPSHKFYVATCNHKSRMGKIDDLGMVYGPLDTLLLEAGF